MPEATWGPPGRRRSSVPTRSTFDACWIGRTMPVLAVGDVTGPSTTRPVRVRIGIGISANGVRRARSLYWSGPRLGSGRRDALGEEAA
jgi:hypothetical protein